MIRQYRLKNYNFRLILWLLILSALGVLVVGSAQEDLQIKQIYGILLSLVVMVVFSLMDYTWIIRFHWLIYPFSIALLVLVDLFGNEVNGATRWFKIGGFQFQPSELVKILLILFFAKFYMDHEENLNSFKVLTMSIAFIAVPLFLIYDQPDLSTTILVAMVFCAMIFIGGLSYKIIGGIIVICIPILVILMSIILQEGQTIIDKYQANRILSWLQPTKYATEASQQMYSIIAIGSGQLSGKGLSTDAVSSVKNGNFISESQTDFIFAIVGEELGFIGGCIIVILILLIAGECIWMGRKAKEKSGTLICSGVAALIVFQSFINICVATGLMPNTGIPLPFVSSGLTSLVSLYLGMGIVLNVGLQSRKY